MIYYREKDVLLTDTKLGVSESDKRICRSRVHLPALNRDSAAKTLNADSSPSPERAVSATFLKIPVVVLPGKLDLLVVDNQKNTSMADIAAELRRESPTTLFICSLHHQEYSPFAGKSLRGHPRDR